MSQPDHRGALQDFFRWEGQSRVEVVADITRDEKTWFMPVEALRSYFRADGNQNLNKVLLELFQTEYVPIDPEVILRTHMAVFCILLRVSKGRYIEHFARYEELSDQRLPFDPNHPPAYFPMATDDPQFLQRFCGEEWMYCVPTFGSHMVHRHFGRQRLLPITYKERLEDNDNAAIYKIMIYEPYNKLIPEEDSQTLMNNPNTNPLILKRYITTDAEKRYNYEVHRFNILKNPENVVRFYGSYIHGDDYNILLEFADKGPLEEYFQRETPPSSGDDIIKFWARLFELIKALKAIHSTLGCHQDVKPANVLVFSYGAKATFDWQFKLTGMGANRSVKGGDAMTSDFRDTHAYGAPECYALSGLSNQTGSGATTKISPEADIWSLGCIYSEAAMWIADGHKGVVEYRQQRMAETGKIPNFEGGDCFHDGERVLGVVSDAHENIGQRLGRSDYITKDILDSMVVEMLWDEDRPDPKRLWRKAEGVLSRAKQRLSSSAAEDNSASHNVSQPHLSPRPHHSSPQPSHSSPQLPQSAPQPPQPYPLPSPQPPQSTPQPPQPYPPPLQSSPQLPQSTPQPPQPYPLPLQSFPPPSQSYPQPSQSYPQPPQPYPQPLHSSPQLSQSYPQSLHPSPHPLHSSPQLSQASPQLSQASPQPFHSSPQLSHSPPQPLHSFLRPVSELQQDPPLHLNVDMWRKQVREPELVSPISGGELSRAGSQLASGELSRAGSQLISPTSVGELGRGKIGRESEIETQLTDSIASWQGVSNGSVTTSYNLPFDSPLPSRQVSTLSDPGRPLPNEGQHPVQNRPYSAWEKPDETAKAKSHQNAVEVSGNRPVASNEPAPHDELWLGTKPTLPATDKEGNGDFVGDEKTTGGASRQSSTRSSAAFGVASRQSSTRSSIAFGVPVTSQEGYGSPPAYVQTFPYRPDDIQAPQHQAPPSPSSWARRLSQAPRTPVVNPGGSGGGGPPIYQPPAARPESFHTARPESLSNNSRTSSVSTYQGAMPFSLEHLSLVEALEWKKAIKNPRRYSLDSSLRGANMLDVLKDRDHVFIIDDGSSMRETWPTVKEAFEALSYILKPMAPSGIELFFTVSYETWQRKDTKELVEKLEKKGLGGDTNISYRLKLQLESYKLKITPEQTTSRRGSTKSKRIRPLCFYILTDGSWKAGGDPAAAIKDIADALIGADLTRGQVAIQFISFGEKAAGLQRMNDLADTDFGLHIVDTTPSNGNVLKMLLGAVNKNFSQSYGPRSSLPSLPTAAPTPAPAPVPHPNVSELA